MDMCNNPSEDTPSTLELQDHRDVHNEQPPPTTSPHRSTFKHKQPSSGTILPLTTYLKIISSGDYCLNAGTPGTILVEEMLMSHSHTGYRGLDIT